MQMNHVCWGRWVLSLILLMLMKKVQILYALWCTVYIIAFIQHWNILYSGGNSFGA